LNIAIITSNDHYRESLKTVLNQIPRFKVTLVCRNRNDAATQIAGKTINVVLLDNAVCEDDSEGFVKQIHMLSPKAKILMLLNHIEECWYTQAMKSGADDAIPKFSGKRVIEQHVRSIMEKNTLCRNETSFKPSAKNDNVASRRG
jgi:DNA-binding NarL/FixJ family response regulator